MDFSIERVVGVCFLLLAPAAACSSSPGTAPGVADAGSDASDAPDTSKAPDTSEASDSSHGVDVSTAHDSAPASMEASNGDASLTCPNSAPFVAPRWAPPAPLHQGACTAAQVAAWISSQTMMTGLGTSGSAACDACIATPDTASAYGPYITTTHMGATIWAGDNLGGCLADETGSAADAAMGGCGNQLTNYAACELEQCSDCSDWGPNYPPTGPTAMCLNTIGNPGGACDFLTDQCEVEATSTPVQPCLNSTQAEWLELWCGSATAGTDGGGATDSGREDQ
jgi:hypothetical protein